MSRVAIKGEHMLKSAAFVMMFIYATVHEGWRE